MSCRTPSGPLHVALDANPRLRAAVHAMPLAGRQAPPGGARQPPLEMHLLGSCPLLQGEVSARMAVDALALGCAIQGHVTRIHREGRTAASAEVRISSAFTWDRTARRLTESPFNHILPQLRVTGVLRHPEDRLEPHDAVHCAVVAKTTAWGGDYTPHPGTATPPHPPLLLSTQEKHLADPELGGALPLGYTPTLVVPRGVASAGMPPGGANRAAWWLNGLAEAGEAGVGAVPLDSPFYRRHGFASVGAEPYRMLAAVEECCCDDQAVEALASRMGVSLGAATQGPPAPEVDYLVLRDRQHIAYAGSLVAEGAALTRRKDFDAAVDCFHKALGYHRGCADAYVGLGAVMANRGDYTGGAAAFEKALGIDPAHANAKKYLDAVGAKLRPEAGGRGDRRRRRRASDAAADSGDDARAAKKQRNRDRRDERR